MKNLNLLLISYINGSFIVSENNDSQIIIINQTLNPQLSIKCFIRFDDTNQSIYSTSGKLISVY